MYSDWIWQLLFGAVFIWLLGLSFFLVKQHSFLKNLIPNSKERDVRKRFEEILKQIEGFDGKLRQLTLDLSALEKDGFGHIQRVKLMRYNPYDDVGGDQSFSIALLNKEGTGVIITSLHNRSGTRVFAKPVVKGKSDKYEFSGEEKQVIKEAFGGD